MKKGGTGQVLQKDDTGFERFESVLLTACLCVLAVRATYIESPHGGLLNPRQFLTNEAFSVILSGILVITAVAWFAVAFCRRTVVYRFSGIELGAGLFLLAGAAGISAASNKRVAINDLATMIAPMAAAVMLVQVLSRQDRLRVVLFVIFALGAVTTVQCFDQRFAGNEEMIADYERDPQRHLEVIGAEAGSFEQMLYEHRLYGKDIRGFLTTSNSTGSLLLLAAFAAIGFAADCIMGRRDRSSNALIACSILAAAFSWAGLLLVQSRGALGGAAVGAVLFAAAIAFGQRLWRFRGLLLLLSFIGVLAVIAGVITYGMTYDALPGGASMLVRWQYWKGAAAMYADNPLTGVGGGNFATYYLHYKIAAAPETVSDPHNFLLSLLSQYGPVGLIGFLAAFTAVLYRSIFCAVRQNGDTSMRSNGHSAKFGLAVLAVVSLAMLVVRPVLNAAELGDRIDVMVYVIVILYIVPVIVFGVFFVLLWLSGKDVPAIWCGSGLSAGLFCGIVAAAIHNTIDFAIFEPAVLTLFWMSAACLFAADSHRKRRAASRFVPNKPLRLAVVGGAVLAAIVFVAAVLAPTAAAGRLTQRALNDVFSVTELLEEAARLDPLSPSAPSMAGKTYVQRYSEGAKNSLNLAKASASFENAIRRDPAYFKHYEKIGQVHELMATASADQRRDHLKSAFEAFKEAVKRYPGSDRLHLKLGQLADALVNRDAAIEHYGRVIEIEDAYRRQFAIMYPGRELFSRLGESNYQFAKARLAQLRQE